jgi:radical SAM superfamily enzyme YgiQ (UPF0313 family)
MKKKALFIIPPHGAYDTYVPKGPGQKKYFLTPPYGVLSILSYVSKNRDHEGIVFDCNKFILEYAEKGDLEAQTVNAIEMAILMFQPDYICISALFNTSFSHMRMTKYFKEHYPDIFICVGGGLATNLYEELLEEFPAIDAICFGEGEIPMKKLLDEPDTKICDLHKLSPAWVTRDSLAEGFFPSHDIVHDLDKIPLVDFSYIQIEKYNGRSYIDKDSTKGKVEVSMHTSRGCPFNCVFCANGRLHGKKVRMMSVERVIETIQHYKDNYGMTILIIEDDHFLHDKERALKILKFAEENDITLEFPNGVAVYKIDHDIAKALADAKVRVIVLAIESGSNYVLKKLIDKPLRTKKIKEAVEILRQYDIRIHVFVVIGLPEEFDEDRAETLDFLIRLDIDWAYIFIATPIVGSRLYKICKEKGYLIDDSYDNHVVSRCNIRAPGIDPKEIEEYAYYMNTMVNFIYNSNVIKGRTEVAREYFQNVVKSYPTQAIAYYMLSQIAEDQKEKGSYRFFYLRHYDEHIGVYKNSRIWKNLIENFFVRT